MKLILDWDGTIVKPDVAKEASTRRFKYLGSDVDQEWLARALKTNEHYAINKQLISQKTGITDDRLLTIEMTTLFKKYYLEVVNEWREKIFYPGMLKTIETLFINGNEMAIATGLRQDIIEGSLEIFGAQKYFKAIVGDTPDLSHGKEVIVRMAKKKLRGIDFMIGDKQEDLDAGRKNDGKTIYVTWGATGADLRGRATYTVDKPEELLLRLR